MAAEEEMNKRWRWGVVVRAERADDQGGKMRQAKEKCEEALRCFRCFDAGTCSGWQGLVSQVIMAAGTDSWHLTAVARPLQEREVQSAAATLQRRGH
jgi:hypothetical protein